MARHSKHKTRIRRERTIHQDSPFLELPREIRDLIYREALVKPRYIDICPAEYFELGDDTQDPILVQELTRKRAKCNCCINSPGKSCANVWKIRHQRDLQFVRKELATGLLATCRQIFDEAQRTYWYENTFRFSDDCRWNGVRRFLATIGSRACTQLRSLEVCAPLYGILPMDYRNAPSNFRGVWGNFPKMHMQKFGKDPMDLDYWNFYQDNENIEAVFQLFDQAQVGLELRFMVPTGECKEVMQYARHFYPGVPPLWPTYRLRVDLPDIHFNEHVLKARPRWSNGMTLVLEAGAQCRDGIKFFERCALMGINVVCYPGSFYRANPSLDLLTEITETRWWTDPDADDELYFGISNLLIEMDKFSAPGRGGRATKGTGQKKMLRRLKGFGGCRFIERSGFDCMGCGKTGIYISHSGVQNCSHCFTSSSDWEKRRVVEMKSMLRAIRKGHVDASMVLTRNRFQSTPPLT